LKNKKKMTDFIEFEVVVGPQATKLLACTFSDTGSPKDGGTADTWNKATCPKFHIDLFKYF